MTQEVVAIYDTIYETPQGANTMIIVVQPGSATPNTVAAEQLLGIGKKFVNNNTGIEGELIMKLKNTLADVDWEIDDDGNLIIHAEDANNYSLDDEGNLI